MNVDDFLFDLPEELIAAYPADRRDESRLLALPAGSAPLHRQFCQIGEFLRPGDVLVMNDTRVIPARLFARRAGGGQTEMLLLERRTDAKRERWTAMLRPAKKARAGDILAIAEGFTATVIEELPGGERLLELFSDQPFAEALQRHGHTPLPRYILKRRQAIEEGKPLPELDHEADRERYQTVYAREEGSVAAPTAGLHFTEQLLAELEAKGVERRFLTLHVGAGTFVSMAEGSKVEEHAMHREIYRVPEETAGAVTRAVREGRRVVAVGTTSVRTLESAWDREGSALLPGPGETELMIAPGYQWGCTGAMITNFHLPRSTLILLVSAMAGRERILAAYGEAIRDRYRFFSYGDAMWIERPSSR